MSLNRRTDTEHGSKKETIKIPMLVEQNSIADHLLHSFEFMPTKQN
jgi:hypothetical protein